MKKVLIVTYGFPPRPTNGSIRLGGLAKYLSEFGWEPIILTPTLPGPPDKKFRVVETFYPGETVDVIKKKIGLNSKDGVFEKMGVPVSMRESRNGVVPGIKNFIKVFIDYPDRIKYWHSFAVKSGIEILRNEKVDMILSSSDPVTTHLIAKDLKTASGVPWVADLRDLWTQCHYYSFGSVRRFLERRLELRTFSSVDALVTVSEPLAQQLALLHKTKNIFSITNGFEGSLREVSTPLTQKLTITYAGILYDGKRDPKLLFQALQNLIKNGKVDPHSIQIRFWGPQQYWLEKEIGEYGLQEVACQYGVTTRKNVLLRQRESQILLLLNWDHPEEVGVLPGKIFEYFAAKRPIMAIGGSPEGAVNCLLKETGAGEHFSNVESVKNSLMRCYREYKEKGFVSYTGKTEQINKYTHYEMTKRFVKVFDSVYE